MGSASGGSGLHAVVSRRAGLHAVAIFTIPTISTRTCESDKQTVSAGLWVAGCSCAAAR